MRILWVKADRLLPVHNGGNIRSYHIARHLAARHEVTFFSYYAGAVDRNYEEELEKCFPKAVSMSTGNPEMTGVRRGVDYLVRLPARAPYAVSRFSSSAVRARIEGWFQKSAFDVAVCDFLDAAVNFPTGFGIPSVLFQHNVESEIWRRYAETESSRAKRQMYRMEYWKMLRYERAMVRNFGHVIAVSENDRELMSAWVDPVRITVVPTGVDLQNFHPSASGPVTQAKVVFVGAMDWEPNIDGVGYFCDEVWPSILRRLPDARLRVVGRNPGQEVLRLASDSVEILGSVPSVVEYLREAAVVVVPLRIGGGTRLKIYEAMAAGKAVVSTTIGAEGLDVHHGKDIWLADDPASFANAVVVLLQDQAMRRRFEQAAAALATERDWSAVAEKFEQILQAAASPAREGGTLQLATAG
ncbi:MAG: glycosyltransferase family 4 protein [Acidobacteriia bacterium]|nr:glycosyltransferase family 4 protein [Terriglobia bacterium]